MLLDLRCVGDVHEVAQILGRREFKLSCKAGAKLEDQRISNQVEQQLLLTMCDSRKYDCRF